jgi:hypothetical protein
LLKDKPSENSNMQIRKAFLNKQQIGIICDSDINEKRCNFFDLSPKSYQYASKGVLIHKKLGDSAESKLR